MCVQRLFLNVSTQICIKQSHDAVTRLQKDVKVFPYVKAFWVAHIHASLGGKEDDRSRFVAMNLAPGLLMKCQADQCSGTLCCLSCSSTFTASQLPWPLKKCWFISLGNLYIWVRTEYLHVSETFSRQVKICLDC